MPLAARGVTLRFGGVIALDGVTVEVRQDELLAIIGPNGAGKTSLLNVLSGFYRPQSGQVELEGESIRSLRVDQVARRGVARTFQGTHLFAGQTVIENILVGRDIHMRTNILQAFCYFHWVAREESHGNRWSTTSAEDAHRHSVEEIIDFLEIEAIRNERVGTLGYGLRKRVDLGRALAQEPRILLMDEPMAGMNSEEKEDLARFILDVREARKTPVVLVEHDMGVVMDLADRIVVLDFGRVIAEGTPAEMQRNPDVIRAYLGEAQ